MTDRKKSLIKKMAEQLQSAKSNILICAGYLPLNKIIGDIPQDTTAMHFIKELAKNVGEIENSLCRMLSYDYGYEFGADYCNY